MSDAPHGRADQRGPQLLDVLRIVSVPVLRASFWSHLPLDAQASFRLVSHEGLHLSRPLQQRFTLGRAGFDVFKERRPRRAAYLARCENLEVLDFQLLRKEKHLVELLQVGGAACRHVWKVSLLDSALLEGDTGSALALACPALESLHVTRSDLGPPFVNALGRLQLLTKVHLTDVSHNGHLASALTSLGALHTLRIDTDEEPHPFSPLDLKDLPALPGLRDLCLFSTRGSAPSTAEDLHPLSALSRLTRLTVATLGSHTSERLSLSGAYDGPVNARLACLATMQCLVSLDITDMGACVNATGFAGLRQLSRLTRLHVDSLNAEGSTPHSLPLLQDLRLAWPLSNSGLCGALRSLLPLSELVTLRVHLSLKLANFLAAQGTAMVANGVDAVSSASCGLKLVPSVFRDIAALPQLQRICLTLVCGQGQVEQVTRTELGQILQALPLRVIDLTLRACSIAQLCGLSAVLASCPYVTSLHLEECEVGDNLLIDLAVQGTSLRSLRIGSCSSCSGATPLQALAFAVARVQPLQLSWAGLTNAEAETIQASLRLMGKHAVVCLVPYAF